MRRIPYILLSAALLAGAALAQTTNGTIMGSVRDASGLGVAGADVRIIQSGTGAVRRGTTNERGDFALSSVVAGEYDVTVSAPGFKTAERKSVVLSASETLALGDLALEVGSVSETVTVT
ncbi:MAG: carboxypeptidase-like regulatory domain-containing protein, partial [Vicinamibacterales bacterium]